MAPSRHGIGRVDRPQSNQFQRILAVEPAAFAEVGADAVFCFGHHAPQTKIQGRGAAIELIASGMTLFNAHNPQSFGAIWHGVKFFSGLHKAPDHRISVDCRYGYFISQLA